ncbi:hypothetical protein ACFQAV_04640 [Companilactobacillus huachuanensis]|uniref:ISLre2 family transposase n=1 Tax=Companilactobacillus huachuanensis TaxID=2559914 RepID=A0ABW1RM78_9LACO|nr:hypothetical protein [Companilactobacillus huachuanensis]
MSKLTGFAENILIGANKTMEKLSMVVRGLERGVFSVNELLQSEFLEQVQQIQQPEQIFLSYPNQKILTLYRR